MSTTVKEKKVSKTSIIREELLVGGVSLEEVRDRIVKRVPDAKASSIMSQIKGVLSHIKKAESPKWKHYKLVEGKVAIQEV